MPATILYTIEMLAWSLRRHFFQMSAPPSIHAQSFTANLPVAEGHDGSSRPDLQYYPGRNVSVQLGRLVPISHSISNARVRIFLLLDIASVGMALGPPALLCVGIAKVQLPAVIVLAAGEPNINAELINEQTITLFVEPRFLRETVSSLVTGVNVVDLADLVRKDALAAPLADVFRQLFQSARNRNSQYIEALGVVMAAHVLHFLFDGQAPKNRRRGLSIEAEQRVVAYIDVHYAEEFDVDALAKASGYSRNHFQRLFKKSFNQTPRDYVRSCQVQQAITLIQTTKLKGLDVALACGFCDETQMARWFWKLRGCPPSRVREADRW